MARWHDREREKGRKSATGKKLIPFGMWWLVAPRFSSTTNIKNTKIHSHITIHCLHASLSLSLSVTTSAIASVRFLCYTWGSSNSFNGNVCTLIKIENSIQNVLHGILRNQWHVLLLLLLRRRFTRIAMALCALCIRYRKVLFILLQQQFHPSESRTSVRWRALCV